MRDKPVTGLERNLARERAFHSAVARWAAHDLKDSCAVLELATSGMVSDIGAIEKAQEVMSEVLKYLPEALSAQFVESFSQPLQLLKSDANMAASAARRTSDVASLLRFSSDIKGYVAVDRENFPVIDRLDSLFDFYKHRFITRKLMLRLNFKPEKKDREVNTNPFVFDSVVANLLGNAIKYSTGQSTIDFLVDFTDTHLVIQAENYAPKMLTSDELKYILGEGNVLKFDRFESGMASQGLGLYLVGSIMREGYGGRLSISSLNKKKIGDARVEGCERRVYPAGVPVFPDKSGEPLFYACASFPLTSLTLNP